MVSRGHPCHLILRWGLFTSHGTIGVLRTATAPAICGVNPFHFVLVFGFLIHVVVIFVVVIVLVVIAAVSAGVPVFLVVPEHHHTTTSTYVNAGTRHTLTAEDIRYFTAASVPCIGSGCIRSSGCVDMPYVQGNAGDE